MENIFITSDLHFYHKNIIKYCNRPYSFDNDGIHQMNEDILSEFDKLPYGSIIYNLGDILLNSAKSVSDIADIVARMKINNKKLILIMGNHDRELHRFIKSGDLYASSYDLLKDIGFDEVYKYPILLEDKYLLSHEPIYNGKDSKLNLIHGHTHDIDLDKDYFNRECENWAMMERVKKEAISKQKNLDIDTKIKKLGKEINPKNYFNVCWDKHHQILPFNEVIEYFKNTGDKIENL